MGLLNRILGIAPSPPVIKPAALSNPFVGRRLSYLIGTDNPWPHNATRVLETGYDVEAGEGIAYCNLFNEKYAGQSASERAKYGPYLHGSDTAWLYNEGQIDPFGIGWERNLMGQLSRRLGQGYKYIELDNCDAYPLPVVLDAYDWAAKCGFQVIAKNPGICGGGARMVAHPAVVGIIVEKDCGTPALMDKMRIAAGKPNLPVWFVCFDKLHAAGPGWRWGHNTFRDINDGMCENRFGMFVTWSRGGEYVNAIDF